MPNRNLGSTAISASAYSSPLAAAATARSRVDLPAPLPPRSAHRSLGITCGPGQGEASTVQGGARLGVKSQAGVRWCEGRTDIKCRAEDARDPCQAYERASVAPPLTDQTRIFG
jgi:hypothetical protein